MKIVATVTALVLAASSALAEIPLQRVVDDAKAVDRVAEASKKDLPQDLLKRIVNEDIELLRGKRADGTYEFATYERLEADRDSASHSVQPKNETATVEIRGSFVYRLLIEVPSRRLLVARNRRLFIDHVEIEYIPVASTPTRSQSVKVEAWLDPGQMKTIDLNEVARQATVRVFVKADKDAGYGNIVLTLVKAKVIDNADSPYADAVLSAKAVIRGVDNYDIPSIRAMAGRIRDDLQRQIAAAAPPAAAPQPATGQTVEVMAPRAVADSTDTTAAQAPDVYNELQTIEDLLTGSDAEKRAGMDRLHQLLKRLRTR